MRVIPRSHRTQIAGIRHGAILVRVAAPPVEGSANEALLTFFASVCGIRRAGVTLVAGERGRNKRLAVSGVTAEELATRLKRMLERPFEGSKTPGSRRTGA